MTRPTNKTLRWRAHRIAFSLVESTISIILVSVMLVVALDAVGSSKLSQRITEERGRAYLLAQALASEIMRQPYVDPDLVVQIDLRAMPVVTFPIQLELDESGLSRADFDDVDDYHNWTASPPQQKDGTEIPDLTGWSRSVTVERRKLSNTTLTSLTEEGVKVVHVEVQWADGKTIAVEAIKGAGLPPESSGPAVLFVVDNVAALTAQELARQTQMESWGFTVQVIAGSSTQTAFDSAFVQVDVVYIPFLSDVTLGLKLRDAPVGIVSEYAALAPDFGLASSVSSTGLLSILNILDNTHYITSESSLGSLTIVSLLQSWTALDGTTAAGLVTLASGALLTSTNTLSILDEGAVLYGGGTAAGRRVQLPWGNSLLDLGLLSAEGQTILRRAIEWAAGKEQPTATETPL